MAATVSSNPTTLTQSSYQVFQKAVKYILTEWPSLTFAVENGQGGSQAKEKIEWICNTICEAMLKQKDIDLDDYLGQMIDQEFDTWIEDGSLEYNTKWIERFYKDCCQGKEQEVLNSIDQASKKKLSLSNVRIPPPVCQDQDSDDDDSEMDDEDD